MAKIISWNVNGIRAVYKNGFASWFKKQKADIYCVQETKAQPNQLTDEVSEIPGFSCYWHSAEKKGYSGVAIFSREKPLDVQAGIGIPEIDREGRVLAAEYENFVLVNAYFPNSQREHTRLDYKLFFCNEMEKFLSKIEKQGKEFILCGDYNIAHREIDLRNPKSNQKNAGFLPEERAWMDGFLDKGRVDLFRHFNPEPDHYTWWSYRPGVREKNIGWRIDYFCSSPGVVKEVKKVAHQANVMGSDHCPIELQLKF